MIKKKNYNNNNVMNNQMPLFTYDVEIDSQFFINIKRNIGTQIKLANEINIISMPLVNRMAQM